jgi:hypothetical protein
MTPEELNLIINRPPVTKEYRLYYNAEGMITMFAEQDYPIDDNYIVLDDPNEFYSANALLLRVKDGKLVKINPVVVTKSGLQRSMQGQRVVKGKAALPLMPNETYQDVEYYDLKRNC